MSELYYYDKYTVKTTYSGWRKPIVKTIKDVQSISESYSTSGYPTYNFENGEFNFRGIIPITIYVQQGENNQGVYTQYYNGAETRYIVFKQILGDTRIGNLTINTFYEYAYRYETKSQGTYIETIQALDGAYPDDGEKNGFWYVKKGLVFPELKFKINNQIRTASNGWVKINNQLWEIDKIWTKVNNQIKEVI